MTKMYDKNVLTKETLCGNVCLSTGKCFSFRKKYKGRCVYGKEKRRNKKKKKRLFKRSI